MSKTTRVLAALVPCLVLAIVLAFVTYSETTSAADRGPVEAAWQRATDAGSYTFQSDIEQVTTPTATVRNAGRTSREELTYLEGQADIDAATMEFSVWPGGRNLARAEAAQTVRVADGETYQQSAAGEWEALAGSSNVAAPTGDLLVYLQAAAAVTVLAPETRGGTTFERYAFEVDGPAFAAAVTRQLEDAMNKRGELRAGQRLVAPSQYSELTGDGELWIDPDGFPARQLLSLHFGEQEGETVQAHITIDFSQFGQASRGVTAGGSWSERLGSHSLGLFQLAGFLLLVLALVVAAYRSKGGRRQRVGLSLTVAAGLFAGVLVAAPPVASGGPRGPEAGDVNTRTTPVDAAELVTAARAAGLADPHLDRLGSDAASARQTVSPGDGFAVAAVTDTTINSDGDSLTDFVEVRIGTDPLLADTDGDTIPDDVEVNGFELAGRRWFPDPTNVDSNGDGLGDALEYDATGDGVPDDLDGDGVPDVFDNDNDGDGVPDHMDLAPVSRGASSYSRDDPFKIEIDNTNADESLPLFVDFQVRPTDGNENQLQYALRPLDWPADSKGQIRDLDDQPDDLELVPLLEIIIPTPDHVLPGDDELGPYAITWNDLGGGRRAIYVPLSLTTDNRTGEKVAFRGRMRYESQADWGDAHEVRMVWAVQVDNDVRCSSEADPKADPPIVATPGCDNEYLYNQPQVVHRYYEDWNLTGLSVTEEHGSDVALIYEDPAVDDDVTDDRPQWLLADVLGQTFLTSRTVGDSSPAERGATIDDLPLAYDRLLNDGATAGPYTLPNIFRVVPQRYDTFDELVKTADEENLSILTNNFDAAWANDASTRPLLMTAYESRSRSQSLDSVTAGGPYFGFDANTLSIDLQPTGADDTPVNTTAGVKWTSYCGGDQAQPDWVACGLDQVWLDLEDRFGTQELDPLDPLQPANFDLDADVSSGQNVIMQLYAATMLQGVTAVVATESSPGVLDVLADQFARADDLALEQNVRSGMGAGNTVKTIANFKLFSELENAEAWVKIAGKRNPLNVLGGKVKNTKAAVSNAQLSKLNRAGRGALGASALIGLGALITLSVLTIDGDETAEIALNIMLTGITVTAGIINPMITMQRIKTLPQFARASILSISSEYVGLTKRAVGIGTGVAIAVTWGLFIMDVVGNGVSFASPRFNLALADTISATIYIVFLAMLSLTGVGLILVGILTLIDLALTLACQLDDDAKEALSSDFVDGECLTISGTLIKAGTALLYSHEPMIDVERENRDEPLVDLGTPEIELADRGLGYVVGNGLTVEMPVTTNIAHNPPGLESWHMTPAYLWFYSRDNLKSTTFDYSITSDDETLSAERDTMNSAWTGVAVDDEYFTKDLYRARTNEDLEVDGGIPFTDAGMNQAFDFSLNMGYALPAFECWTVPQPLIPPYVAPVCYKRTIDDSTSTSFDPLYYDIFPASLTDFVAISERPAGNGFAWDGSFPAMNDADGDGALSGAAGGLDPDDRDWDTDGDGLSDLFELEQREQGVPLSTRMSDTDVDGLTDAQELRVGTNPGVADTDNDGLLDGEEVGHLEDLEGRLVWTGGWDVTINDPTGRVVTTTSDPLTADTDDDGISDLAEKELAETDSIDEDGVPFHPRVVNVVPIAISLSTDDVDGFVGPNQNVTISADVTATQPLSASVLDLGLPEVFGPSPAPLLLDFNRDTFVDAQTRSQQIDVTVGDGTSQPVTVAADVRAWTGSQPTPASWKLTPSTKPIVPTKLFAHVDVTSRREDRADSYVVAEMSGPLLAGVAPLLNWPGDVNNVPLSVEAGAPTSLDDDQDTTTPTPRPDNKFLYRPGTPSVACTDGGVCMTVWEQYDNCSTLTLDRLKVVDQEEPDSSGIEPGIYISREGTGLERLWFSGLSGGNQMKDGDTRGPNSNGFPVSTEFCGDASLALLEIDGSSSNPTPPTGSDHFQLTEQIFVGNLGPWAASKGNFFSFDQESTENSRRLIFTSKDYREAQLGGIGEQCAVGTNRCNRVDIDVSIEDRQHYTVGGAVVNGAGEVVRRFDTASTPGARELYPVVVSDGVGFTVVSQRISPIGGSQIVQRIYDADATLLDTKYLATLSTEGPVELAAAWTGQRYLIAWKVVGDTTIYRSDQGERRLVTTASSTSPDAYDLAIDPLTGRSLLVYSDTAGQIRGRSFETPATYEGFDLNFDDDEMLFASGVANFPKATYNPISGGWFVGVTDQNNRQLLAWRDAELAALDQFDDFGGATLVDSTLACPASTALPVVNLLFEELPGATTFADTSRYGNDATSTVGSAPSAAVAGAPGANNSDFAVSFDDATDKITVANPVDNGITISFWYRAEPGGVAEDFVIDGGYRLSIDNVGDSITWDVGGRSARIPDAGVADGEWHFITAKRGNLRGGLALYVDAEFVASSLSVPSPSFAPTVDIGGGGTTVHIDQLQIYATDLSTASIQGLYDRSRQSFCVVVGTTPPIIGLFRNSPWARLDFTPEDPRGGRLEKSAELGLVVDNDGPVSQAIVRSDGAPVRGPHGGSVTVIVAGTADDATSGISKVEVSIDGGTTWALASGAESWSIQLEASDGSYSILTRATDAVGNVEEVGQPTEVRVDGVAPTVTLTPPPTAAVAPELDAITGQASIALTGTVADATSGVATDGVEVQLTAVDGPVRDDAWQVATHTDGAWTIDSLFSSTSDDVSGSYTVLVRAIDGVGNRTADDAATGAVFIDAAAPIPTLRNGDSSRQMIARTVTIGGRVTDEGAAGISSLDVILTPIEAVIFRPGDESSLGRPTPPIVLPATLAASGPGVQATTWRLQVPADLENFYEMSLRTVDGVGNENVVDRVWGGIIDTKAPRVTLVAEPTGDVSRNGRRIEVDYRCEATDLFLSRPKFDCPGNSVQPSIATFNTDSALQSVFPDQSLLAGLESTYTLWQRVDGAPPRVSACDIYGNCAADTADPLVSELSSGTPSGGNGRELLVDAVAGAATLSGDVLIPTSGQHVAVSDTIDVMIAAESPASVKRIIVSLDGNSVAERRFDQNETDRYEELVDVAVPAGGFHTLALSVEDWTGAVDESTPVEFFVDVAPPVVTYDSRQIALEDTWGVGSDMVRFGGDVSDDGTIAAVQLRVGDGPWVDAAFDEDGWRTAALAPNADGTSVDVGVRAFDLAGRSTEITTASDIDLDPAEALVRPTTTIVDGPQNASPSQVVFDFSSVAGTNPVATFACRLDDLEVEPCGASWTLDDLAAGPHTLLVAAVDDEGYRDLSSSKWSWSVAPNGPQPTLDGRPADPSPAEAAAFSFTGPPGASFECAVDALEFTACVSPFRPSDLTAGMHTFLVRALVDGVVGTAVTTSWTVTNESPAAFDQSVGVRVDDEIGRSITLEAQDTDPLVFRLVTPPRHGYLEGTPPDMNYVPFADYLGSDSFTFTADDGQSVSNLATVEVDVRLSGPPTVIVSAAVDQPDPTNATPLVFDVVFDQPVTGFDAADIVVGGTATTAASTTTVVPVTSTRALVERSAAASTYTVTVADVSGAGTVEVSIAAGAAVNSIDEPNLVSAVAAVEFDAVRPMASLDLATGQQAVAVTSPVRFAVAFDEVVSGFDADDVDVTGTARGTNVVVSGAGADYVVTVERVTMAGTVIVAVADGAAVDAAGNESSSRVVADTVTVQRGPILPIGGNGSLPIREALLLILAGLVLLLLARTRRARTRRVSIGV